MAIEKPTGNTEIPFWILGVIAIIFIGMFVLFGIVVNVPAGNVGVLFDRLSGGVVMEPLNEGWHLAIPFVQTIYVIPIQTQKVEYPAEAASKDLQIVDSNVAVSFHIIKSEAPILYKTIGADFSDKMIAPAVQEKFKANTAKFNAEDLIQRREVVKAAIAEDLTILLDKYGIKVDEVSITNFKFSEQFNSAIESKVVAQQQRLTAENILAVKQVEAQQKIAEAAGVANSTVLNAEANAQAVRLKAEADAYALKIQREQITPELINLRTVERWNGQLPTITSGANPFLMINSGIGVANATTN